MQAGVVFKSSADGSVRGYIDKSSPQALTTSCNSGTDKTIADNWPQLFAAGVTAFFQVVGSAPDPSQASANVWNGSSFVNFSFVPLSGSHVACAGTGSGSSLFPFPAVGADAYVAAIVAATVANALKAGKTVVPDVEMVTQVITAPGFSSPATQSLLAYVKIPSCKQVIADASVIATQLFLIVSQQGGKTPAMAPGNGKIRPTQTPYLNRPTSGFTSIA